jgi:hypothetical protein
MSKELYSAAAMALTLIAFMPYIRSIRKGETKPHVFSWIIWGLTTCVVFLAQLADDAGLGAWPVGVSGVITIYIAWLAYKQHADDAITRSDWAFLIAALSALPVWFFTSDPMWAVIVLTLVDVLGFGPTLRRGYAHPQEESLSFFGMFVLRNALVLLALEHYSVTTVLFPAAVGVGCVLLIFLVAWRRWNVAALVKAKPPAEPG